MEHLPFITLRFFYKVKIGGKEHIASIDNVQRSYVDKETYARIEKSARKTVAQGQNIKEEDVVAITEEEFGMMVEDEYRRNIVGQEVVVNDGEYKGKEGIITSADISQSSVEALVSIRLDGETEDREIELSKLAILGDE